MQNIFNLETEFIKGAFRDILNNKTLEISEKDNSGD